jgi:hypothetical protein
MDVLYSYSAKRTSNPTAKDALDAISNLGLTSTSALRVKTPFQLPSRSTLWIVSEYPLKMTTASFEEDTRIFHRKTPRRMQVQSGIGPVWLVPVFDLGPTFVQGWSQLPEELKLQVLACNLTLPNRIGSKTYTDILSPYLRMSPHIAALAQEVYFTRNEFTLESLRSPWEAGSPYNNAWYLSYPTGGINRLIRRLDLDVDLFGGSKRGIRWNHLKALSRGYYGFESLQHVTISFQATCPNRSNAGNIPVMFANSRMSRMRKEFAEDISFACRRELRFDGLGWFRLFPRSVCEQLQRDTVALLESRISFE